ncbi:flavin reductase family protein [Rhodococcus sp. D-1]|uniref:flavin reductase family protein n=1 Tax=Rhodococcus sp. D-1 TaxID=1912238 RepID=UPI000977FF57|nr:flavin reductase family protein [Rhodococcus sp. D-1]OMQ23885.1 flavin reductase [Rhodococcus sp. D-1]
MRTSFSPDSMRASDFYHVLTSSIVPRAIAWVSTRSSDGVLNLSPYSFFTVASTDPPIVQFTSIGHKDTWRNVCETGEFVVNIAGTPLIHQMNDSSADHDPSVSEFDQVGVTPENSDVVAAPRVAEASVAFECVRHSVIEIGNGSIILGRVVHASITDAVLGAGGVPDFVKLDPLSRLGRSDWGLRTDTLTLARP